MNPHENTRAMSLLQIQPQHDRKEAWEALAGREDLHYEVLELSSPPALNQAERTAAYKRWYLRGSRVTSVHGAFIDVNPASGDAIFRALSRRRCKESCRIALDLGAEHVVFHSSCFPFLRGDYLDSWAGQCASFYEELAESYHLKLYIENSLDVDAAPLRELMRRISNPRIGVCLDIGHANYSHLSLEEWFDTLHDRIGYIHLSDNPGQYDSHLPLGRGTVNWEKADELWRSLNRKTPVTIEAGSPEHTELSLAYLKEHRYFGAGR